MEADAAIFGMMLPEKEEQEPQHFEIFKSNIPAVEAFFALDGCAWKCSEMGIMIGLDYPAAKIIWDGLGVKLSPDTFKNVMVFSRTIADELNKRRKK
jgi:hypothetical protein